MYEIVSRLCGSTVYNIFVFSQAVNLIMESHGFVILCQEKK